MKTIIKVLLSIIGFIVLMYIYAAFISLILIYPIGLIMGWDSGGWVLCLIVSFIISPILSFFSISKIFKGNIKENKSNTNIDKLYDNEINKNNIKILFSDYDNTLFRNEEEIIVNINFIKEFMSKGNKFVIASGRSYGDILPELKKYNIPFNYLVLDDGATIYDDKTNIIYSCSINDNVSKGIYILIKNNEYVITRKIYDINKKDDEYLNNCIKMNFVFNNKDECYRIQNIIIKNFGNYVNTYLSEKKDTISLEIISSKTNKGNGVKKVSKLCDIDKNNIYVIGDNNNDIEMVRDYNGYSISTGIDELKKVAKKSCDSVTELIKEIL